MKQGFPAKPGAEKHLLSRAGVGVTREEAVKLLTTDRKYSSPPPTRGGKFWRVRYQRRHHDKLQAPRVRDLSTPSLARSRGSDKARADPECYLWPQPPRRRGPPAGRHPRSGIPWDGAHAETTTTRVNTGG